MLGHSKNPPGILKVSVIEGRKLHEEDLVGKNDPYVELWIDEKYKQSTTVIKDTNNPVWNQAFQFNLAENSKHKLYLKVNDKDKIGSDKIGEAKVDFDEAFTRPIDTWVKLPAKLGLSSHGEIHLYIEFQPTN